LRDDAVKAIQAGTLKEVWKKSKIDEAEGDIEKKVDNQLLDEAWVEA